MLGTHGPGARPLHGLGNLITSMSSTNRFDFAGLMSGLNLGVMSLDATKMEV